MYRIFKKNQLVLPNNKIKKETTRKNNLDNLKQRLFHIKYDDNFAIVSAVGGLGKDSFGSFIFIIIQFY